jgi:uncharacterized protein YkvS
MPMMFTIFGVLLLIIGLILIVFMWPIVAGMGVYENMDDVPEHPDEGNTYTIMGKIDKAHTEGDYTVMIIEFKDGKTGWVEKGTFDKDESVLFNLKCTDKEDWEDADIGELEEEDDEYWDEWYDSGKQAEEEDLEEYYELLEEGMDENGVEIEVTKPPMVGGIIGMILLIVGIVLLILGIILGAKAKKAGVPPPQQPPPQQQQQQPPPQQQPYYPPPQQQPPQQQPNYPPPQQQPPQQQW